MKPIRRIQTAIVTGLILAGGLIGLAPTSPALINTWTEIDTIDSDSATAANHRMVAFTNDKAVVLWVKASADDLIATECSVSAVLCVDRTVDSSSTAITSPEIYRVSETEAIACYQGGVSGVPKILFTRTTTSGTTWSSPNIVQTNAGGFGTCDVSLIGTTFVVVYQKPTSSFVRTSTDGLTWSAEVQVDAASNGPVDLITENADEWAVVTDASSAARRCLTEDAGATWTCAALTGISISDAPRAYSSSNDTFTIATGSTSTVVVAESDDGGTSFGTSTAATGLTSVQSRQAIRLDADSLGVVFAHTNAVTEPCEWVQTDNNYGAWSVPDGLFTLGATITAAATTASVAESGGIVFVSCEYSPNGGANRDIKVLYGTFSGGAIGSAAVAAFTDLVGFDVDPAGSTLIVRTDNGDFVRTRSAGNLLGGGNQETDCVSLDRVFASYQGELVGFIQCQGSPPPFGPLLWIRTRQMGVPTDDDYGGDCVLPLGEEGCISEIQLFDQIEEASDGVDQLAQVRHFPINYSNSERNVFTPTSDYRVGWAFSGETGGEGRVGFVIFTSNQGGDDYRARSQSYPVGGGVPAEMCVGLDGDQYYLAAVDDSDAAYAWPVTFDDDDVGDVAFGSPLVATAQSQGRGVVCAGNALGVWTPDNTFFIDRASGATISTFTHTNEVVATRGIAASDQFTVPANCGCPFAGDNSLFSAYKDGSTIRLVEALTGTTLSGDIAVPSGTWRGMRMDRTAQNLWVATSTQIVRYSIYPSTTVVPVTAQGASPPPGPAPVPEAIETFAEFLANLLGVGVVAARAIVGLIIMLSLAALGFIVSGGLKEIRTKAGTGIKRDLKWPGIVSGIAAIAGYFINGIIGIWPLWLVIGIPILGLVLFFITKIPTSSGGGGGPA